ncbi:hypoxia up-regulated protein [Anaeramoeba flamelloides]|uniref:Hypoxia up-regulated protein n=1 Tax=Anaeramoeba flamelloides TaxID=1746091 RepID=A0AAV7YEX7_9EUKA|nr:hypoxia up-regulated protein [Anaeramoeba flamelloides]
MQKQVILTLILALSLFTLFINCAVIGIDLGSGSLKVSVKDHGKQLQIALNSASQRKTRSAIAFVEGERLFGKEAEFVSIKQPEYSLINLKSLIGATNETIFEMPFPISQEIAFDPNDGSLLSLTFNDENNLFGLCKQKNEEQEQEQEGEKEKEQEKEQEIKEEKEQEKKEEEEEVDKECKFQLKPEELLSMLFNQAKRISNDFLQLTYNRKVKDCVLTVPSYYGERERQSILDAAELADLNVLSLMNDHSAFAMKYTMNQLTSLKEMESRNVILIDIGSGSAIVSIFNVKSISKPTMIKGKNRTSGLVNVKGVAWDKELSGENLDQRILEYLLDKFDKENESKFPIGKYEKSIRECKSSIGKIKTRIPGWKHILSVNNKAFIHIDSLIGGIDWSSEISKQELEEIGKDLWERISIPISGAIGRSGLLKEDIDQIELAGGSVRIPAIQKEISNYFDNKLELRKSINFDEGATLGAGLLAATLSAQFRVTDIEVNDIQMHDIYVKYQKFDKKKQEYAEKETLIFSQNDQILSSKKLKLKDFNDTFKISVFQDIKKKQEKLFQVNFSDLDQILIDYDLNETAKPSPLLTLSLKVDQNGFVTVKNSKLIFVPNIEIIEEIEVEENKEIEIEEGNLEKIEDENNNGEENHLGNSGEKEGNVEEKKEEEEKEEEKEGEEKEEKEVEWGEKEDEENKSNTEEEEEEEEEKYLNRIYDWDDKDDKRIVDLMDNLQIEYFGKQKFSYEEMKKSKKIIKHFENLDKENQKKLNIKNELESKIYDLLDKMNYEMEEEMKRFALEEEHNDLLKILNDAQDWLYDEGMEKTTQYSEFQNQISEINGISEPILNRIKEFHERPEAIESLEYILNENKEEILKLNQTLYFVDGNHVKEFLELWNKTQEWLEEQINSQSEKKDWEDPVFTVSEIKNREDRIKNKINSIKRKPTIKPTKYEFINGKLVTLLDTNPKSLKKYYTTKIIWKEKKILITENEIAKLVEGNQEIEDEEVKERIEKQIIEKTEKIEKIKDKIRNLEQKIIEIENEKVEKDKKSPKDFNINDLSEDELLEFAKEFENSQEEEEEEEEKEEEGEEEEDSPEKKRGKVQEDDSNKEKEEGSERRNKNKFTNKKDEL